MKNLDFKKLENLGKKYLKYSLVGFICAVLADQLEIIDFISSGFIDLFVFLFLGIIVYRVGKIKCSLFSLSTDEKYSQVPFLGMTGVLLFCWMFFVLPWEIENIREFIKVSDFKVSDFLKIFYAPIFIIILPFVFFILATFVSFILQIKDFFNEKE